MKRPQRTNGRNVVVGEQTGERLLSRQQLLSEGVAYGGRGVGPFQLDCQFRAHADIQLLGHFADSVPPHSGVRTHGLALNKSNVFMSKLFQMFQG